MQAAIVSPVLSVGDSFAHLEKHRAQRSVLSNAVHAVLGRAKKPLDIKEIAERVVEELKRNPSDKLYLSPKELCRSELASVLLQQADVGILVWDFSQGRKLSLR